MSYDVPVPVIMVLLISKVLNTFLSEIHWCQYQINITILALE